MNAVVDEDLSRSFSSLLVSLGFSAFDVRDQGLRGVSDQRVFIFAQEKNAVLFSADLGFARDLSYSSKIHNGIVILRYPNELSVENILRDVRLLLTKLSHEDYKGNLIILSPGKMRIRRIVVE